MPEEQISKLYNDDFYVGQREVSIKGARVIAAYMATRFGSQIHSVVDFGCGTGG